MRLFYLFLEHILAEIYICKIVYLKNLSSKVGKIVLKNFFILFWIYFTSSEFFFSVITLLVTATVSSFGGYWALTVVRVGFAPV